MIKARISTFNISIPHQPVHVLGSMEPVELVRSKAVGDMSLLFDADQEGFNESFHEVAHTQEVYILTRDEYLEHLERYVNTQIMTE